MRCRLLSNQFHNQWRYKKMTFCTQCASREGIYRCSNDGQTIFRGEGEGIPPCSCQSGIWLFFPEDNLNKVDIRPTYLSPIEVIHTERHLHVGDGINLIGGQGHRRAAFIVTRVMAHRGPAGLHPMIEVENAGPIDPELPSYSVGYCAC